MSAKIKAGYFADNGDAEMYYPDAESGLEAAEEYVADGEWGEITSTEWVSVQTWRICDGERIEEEIHKVTLEPGEPDCVELENHEWFFSSFYGHGGGVVEKEICSHCGVIRISDSWAQDSYDGEQGLRSVEYREARD